MRKCDICGTEQKQVGYFTITNGKEGIDNMTIECPMSNIDLMTFIKGKHICNGCMDTYHKIDALYSDMDFSCGGQEYYSDGRNL